MFTAYCGPLSASSSTSPIVIEGLDDSKSYTCYVTAHNQYGNSARSNELEIAPNVEDEFMVQVSADLGGRIEPSGELLLKSGEDLALKLTPDFGYQIDGVSGSCEGSLDNSIFNLEPVTSDCWLTANFSPSSGTLPPPSSVYAGDGDQDDNLLVWWFRVSGADGYRVYVSEGDGTDDFRFVTETTEREVRISGLRGGQRYTVAVTTMSNGYESPTYTTDTGFLFDASSVFEISYSTLGNGDIRFLGGSPKALFNERKEFLVWPNYGYRAKSLEGTCGGELFDGRVLTAPIVKPCTVIVRFEPQDNLECPEKYVKLSTQEAVDRFPQGCAHLPSSLVITGRYRGEGSPITDLSPLLDVMSIGGELSIMETSQLTSLYGLHNLNLNSGNGLRLLSDSLTDISALSKNVSIGRFVVTGNALTSLDQLPLLTNINGLVWLSGSLDDCSALATVAGWPGDWAVRARLGLEFSSTLPETCNSREAIIASTEVLRTPRVAGIDLNLETSSSMIDVQGDDIGVANGFRLFCDDALLQRSAASSTRSISLTNLKAEETYECRVTISNSDAISLPSEPIWFSTSTDITQSQLGEIQLVYIGLLARGVDRPGLAYWLKDIRNGVLTIEDLRSNIVTSQTEYLEGLGLLPREELCQPFMKTCLPALQRPLDRPIG